jgi:AcrR family transcriptional regulator
MAEVARRARVSKETLYARFDSKEGLFYALLAWGARQGSIEAAAHACEIGRDPVEALRLYAQALTRAFMRTEALAVYRMAVGEAGRDPEIGRNFDELACYGDKNLMPRFVGALAEIGIVEQAPLDEMHDALMGLLKGNWHHAVLTGSAPAPSEAEIVAHANRAVALWLRAFAPPIQALAIAAE